MHFLISHIGHSLVLCFSGGMACYVVAFSHLYGGMLWYSAHYILLLAMLGYKVVPKISATSRFNFPITFATYIH